MDQVTPTIIIGLGEAGWRIVDDVTDVVSEHLGNASEAFEYITIDSSWDDMEGTISDEIYPIRLEMPDDYEFDEDKKNYHYLTEDMELATGTGSGQLRGIGRYHMEKKGNRESVRQRLEQLINDHITSVERSTNENIASPTVVDVWVVNALGGGTGSGIFPIVASIIENQLSRTVDANLRVMGIGGTPELNVPHTVTSPVYAANQRMNTYTSLRELQTFLGYPAERNVEFSINNEERPPDTGTSSLFEKYFLLGHGQDENAQNALSEINRAAGSLITFWSLLEAKEDFPDNAVPPISQRNRLYAIDAHELHVPVGKGGSERLTIEDVTEKLERIQSLGEEISTLKDSRKQVKELQHFVEALLEADFRNDSPEEITKGTPVNETFVRSLRQDASSISRKSLVDHETEEILFDLADAIDDIVADDDLLSSIPKLGETKIEQSDEDFRREAVRYVHSAYLSHQIEEHIKDGHPFYEEIADSMMTLAEEKNYEAVQYETESPPFYQFDDPVTAYNSAVSDFYDAQVRELERATEESGGLLSDIKGVIGTSPEEKLEDIETIQKEHRQKHRVYTTIEDIESGIHSEHTAAELTLEGILNEVQDRKATLAESIESKNKKRNSDRRDIRQAINRIGEDYDSDRYHRVSLDLPDDVMVSDSIENENAIEKKAVTLQEIYSNNSSVTDLLRNGSYVDVQTLSNKLENIAVNELMEPKLQNERQDTVANILSIVTNEANFSDEEYNPLNQEVAGERTLGDTLDGFQYHDMNQLQTSSENGFSYLVLALYTELELDAMYEFSHIHEYYSDPDRDTEDNPLGHYNADVSDAEIKRRFAYPEVIDS